MSIQRSAFPAAFTWGAATASFQIEGSTTVDGRGASIWDTFARKPGAIADGRNGEPAADHYRRYKEDVALMADLGINAYRFSIAWPRIQPLGAGRPNPAGIDFYRRLCEELLSKGITPWATLFHWDLPQALEDRGGWLEADTSRRLGEYAQIVSENLDDLVRNWITVNEPLCAAFLGYASGIHAPGKQVGSHAARAAHHILVGHGLATQAIRSVQSDANVGIALNLVPTLPASQSSEDIDAARRLDGLGNRFFLEPVLTGSYPRDVIADLGETAWFEEHAEETSQIATPLDFLGINYYTKSLVTKPSLGDDRPGGPAGLGSPGSESILGLDTGDPKTLMGWSIHPEGLVEVLQMANQYQPALPLIITENGSAFQDHKVNGEIQDEDRRLYLEQHIMSCSAAIAQGLPLKGYFAWSLLDNYEWALGYSRRFGLIHVDFETQVRTLKRSGKWFSDFLKD